MPWNHGLKQVDFPKEGTEIDPYLASRRIYGSSLRTCLNLLESDRVQELCIAAKTDEIFFRKSCRIKTFFTNYSICCRSKLLTNENGIRNNVG